MLGGRMARPTPGMPDAPAGLLGILGRRRMPPRAVAPAALPVEPPPGLVGMLPPGMAT